MVYKSGFVADWMRLGQNVGRTPIVAGNGFFIKTYGFNVLKFCPSPPWFSSHTKLQSHNLSPAINVLIGLLVQPYPLRPGCELVLKPEGNAGSGKPYFDFGSADGYGRPVYGGEPA